MVSTVNFFLAQEIFFSIKKLFSYAENFFPDKEKSCGWCFLHNKLDRQDIIKNIMQKKINIFQLHRFMGNNNINMLFVYIIK